MTISFAIQLAALSLSPARTADVDRVDLVEINHFFDEQGRLVLDQIIYYDWSKEDGRYQVRDWRLLKNDAQIPLRDWRNGGYISVWHDFTNRGVLRRVEAKMMRETWTLYDPEMVERDYLPDEKRRKFAKCNPRTAARQPSSSRRSRE